jgi:hypothetical protein
MCSIFHSFYDVLGAKDSKSWLELQKDITVMQEAALWGAEKAELHKLFRSVQKEVSSSFATIFSNYSILCVL